MYMTRFLTTAAALALMSGAAMAQSAPPAASTPPAAVAPVASKGDLIEAAKASGQLTTFVKAVDAANLTSVLRTNPNLTVFAPTDAAFAALPAGELDRLMKDPTALQKVLTYHVINARVDSGKIIGSKGPVKTVEGDSVVLDGSGATAMVDGARITQADVMATNGVLHVVDKVLMPSTAPRLAATTGATTDAAATAPATPPTPKPTAPSETVTPAPAPTEAGPDAPKETSPPDGPQ